MPLQPSITRQDVVDEARTWIGVPWVHGGRARSGVDCAGLLHVVFSRFASLPPTPAYPIDFFLHRGDERFKDFVEQYAIYSPNTAPLPGDICLYKVGRSLSHGAIVMWWPYVIHAWRLVERVICSESDRGELGVRLAGVWRPTIWS